jgi:hypothetical protein
MTTDPPWRAIVVFPLPHPGMNRGVRRSFFLENFSGKTLYCYGHALLPALPEYTWRFHKGVLQAKKRLRTVPMLSRERVNDLSDNRLEVLF